MSPEQLDGDALDCRADIYSLAARAVPPDRRPAAVRRHAAGGADAPDLPRRAAAAGGAARGRAAAAGRADRSARWPSSATTARPTGTRFAQALSRAGRRPARCRAGRCRTCWTRSASTCCARWSSSRGFGDVELWEVVHRAQWQRYAYGHALYRKGEAGNTFHIIAAGPGRGLPRRPARGAAGRRHLGGRDGLPGAQPGAARAQRRRPRRRAGDHASRSRRETLEQLSAWARATSSTRAFIRVLVRRLHAAHEALAHPRRIL
ncbi:MAG: hypothetical protein MZW92_04535 [Comamonadaceae bacterium]|nr:hypothetical protein [Comamonadaceae bacterium]